MSLNQETQLSGTHAADDISKPFGATTKASGKCASGDRPRRKKTAVAEHMKYHKPTSKRRALKVRQRDT